MLEPKTVPEGYIRFHRNNAHGSCIPELEPHLEFFIHRFEDWMATQSTTVYLERPNQVTGLKLPHEITVAGSSPPLSIVAKRFGSRSLLHQFLSPFTESKALRAFRIGMILYGSGVPTPRPLIAWRQRGLMSTGYCVTEEIPAAHSLREALKTPANEARIRPLLIQLAHLVRGMHDSGIFHRDLTLGNFLVSAGSPEKILLIDLSRAIHLNRVPLLIRLVDLARIKLQEHWPNFFKEYCSGQEVWMKSRPLLDALVWSRRQKMALRKWFKN